jgi:hypothetical protein
VTTYLTDLRRALRGERKEDGQILVLALGYTVVLLLLVSVVVSVTGIQLERKRLANLADTLALASADAVDETGFYDGRQAAAADGGLVLTDDDVATAVGEYLSTHPGLLQGLGPVSVVEARSPDGRSSRVVLTAVARPTLISPVTNLFSGGVTIRAEANAQAE